MAKNTKILIGILVVVLIVIGVWLFYLSRNKTSNNQLSNPASAYCENQGGKLEIREDNNGNQYGVCIFANGNECEEWAFYKGECNKEGKKEKPSTCKNLCGDGICQEIVCMAIGCPCAETLSSCPQDCKNR